MMKLLLLGLLAIAGLMLFDIHPQADWVSEILRPRPPKYSRETLKAMAEIAAELHGIPPAYFKAQIQQESGWNQNAVSPAGAIGIAQIMPGTAKSWGVDPWDPVPSLDAAAKNMSRYWKTYKRQGHPPKKAYALALAAYNAGPGAVKHGKIPPYRETQNYIKNILR